MMRNTKNGGSEYKNWAIRAAKDFKYGKDVIAAINAAKDDNEISRIMTTARKASGK